jgi:hypothetical protein
VEAPSSSPRWFPDRLRGADGTGTVGLTVAHRDSESSSSALTIRRMVADLGDVGRHPIEPVTGRFPYMVVPMVPDTIAPR